MAREIEIANNFGAQERNDIGENGEFEAGDDFFGDGGAAQNIAALEDQNFFARAGEIGRVDQAVVAAADDDDVVALGHGDAVEIALKSSHECQRPRNFFASGAKAQFFASPHVGAKAPTP